MCAMTFRNVRAIGRELPGAEEATSYGAPSLKVGGKMFACMATNKAAEPNTLVVHIDFAQRDALIAEDPDTYYLKEHYVNYPVVLVRLSRVNADALRDLLTGAWRIVSGGRPAVKRGRRAPRRRVL
jgi:hypothetical protein